MPKSSASQRNLASSGHPIRCSEAIWDMKAQEPLQPPDGSFAKGGQLSEESDECEERDGDHTDHDVSQDSHSKTTR